MLRPSADGRHCGPGLPHLKPDRDKSPPTALSQETHSQDRAKSQMKNYEDEKDDIPFGCLAMKYRSH